MSINKRLENLEAASKPVKGYVVLYCDPDQPGIYWDQHFSDPDRRRVTEDDRRALELRHDMVIVEYVTKQLPETA